MNQLIILKFHRADIFLRLINSRFANFQLKVFKKTLDYMHCGLMANTVIHRGIDLKPNRKVDFIYWVHVFQGSSHITQLDIEDKLHGLDIFVHFNNTKNALIWSCPKENNSFWTK